MNDYRFRGISAQTSQWVYGYLFEDIPKFGNRSLHYIIKGGFVPAITMPSSRFIEVDIDSIGFRSSSTDCTGKDIYPGDILSNKWLCVVYKDKNTGAFMVKWGDNIHSSIKNISLYEYLRKRKKAGTAERDNIVIGNIFQHPDLLKTKP